MHDNQLLGGNRACGTLSNNQRLSKLSNGVRQGSLQNHFFYKEFCNGNNKETTNWSNVKSNTNMQESTNNQFDENHNQKISKDNFEALLETNTPGNSNIANIKLQNKNSMETNQLQLEQQKQQFVVSLTSNPQPQPMAATNPRNRPRKNIRQGASINVMSN